MQTSTFNYSIKTTDLFCEITPAEADELIVSKRTGSTTINSREIMTYPILLKFEIPEDFPPCLIDYQLLVTDDE